MDQAGHQTGSRATRVSVRGRLGLLTRARRKPSSPRHPIRGRSGALPPGGRGGGGGAAGGHPQPGTPPRPEEAGCVGSGMMGTGAARDRDFTPGLTPPGPSAVQQSLSPTRGALMAAAGPARWVRRVRKERIDAMPSHRVPSPWPRGLPSLSVRCFR